MSDMALQTTESLDYELRRFTVDEYHRLVEVGILDEDERVELLDGLLILMSPIGMGHWKSHGRVSTYLANLLAGHAFVVPGGSFPLGLHDEPQPDIAVLPPKWPDSDDRPQPPDDMLAFIEISDSSLRKDTRLKARLYGKAGISNYLIVDVTANVALHHTEPNDAGYASLARVRREARDNWAAIAIGDTLIDIMMVTH